MVYLDLTHFTRVPYQRVTTLVFRPMSNIRVVRFLGSILQLPLAGYRLPLEGFQLHSPYILEYFCDADSRGEVPWLD